jgi:hypothetical protein
MWSVIKFNTAVLRKMRYCHDSPDNDHGREPEARRDLLDHDPVRELTDSHAVEEVQSNDGRKLSSWTCTRQ